MINQLSDLLKTRINNEAVELYEQLCISSENTEMVMRYFNYLGSLADAPPDNARLRIKRFILDRMIKLYEEDEARYTASVIHGKKDPH